MGERWGVKLARFGSLLAICLAWISVAVFFVWAFGAIWHFNLFPGVVGPALALVWLVGGVLLLLKSKSKQRCLLVASASIALVWLFTLLQQPSHDREWAADQQQLARIEMDDERVTVHNFRDAEYRSEADFDVRYLTEEFELKDLQRVWFIVQRFSPSEGLAHVFLTFEITQPHQPKRYCALSIEIRREEGESYSPVRGLYREYELNYVFGSELDLIGVRTVMRPSDRLYMYPVNATPEQVQALFRNMARHANLICDRPEHYHSLLNNCMNGILQHTTKLTDERIYWFDPRIVLPGYSERFAFEKGIIGAGDVTFEQWRSECRIDGRARAFGLKPGFSKAIRSSVETATAELPP
jgi:hypothetical protein